MATAFDQVWEAVKSLTAEELRRVLTLVDTLLARQGKPLTKEEELAFLLLKEGIISAIPPPLTERDIARHQSWKPIEIQGKPLSETIIEERR